MEHARVRGRAADAAAVLLFPFTMQLAQADGGHVLPWVFVLCGEGYISATSIKLIPPSRAASSTRWLCA